MTAVTSAVLLDGQPLRVPSAERVRGDLLLLAEGDAVGADAQRVQAASLRVMEASLTGESVQQRRLKAKLAEVRRMVTQPTSGGS